MKAYVITHSSTYEPRAEAVGSWLASRGADVTWIYSDFDHRELQNVSRRDRDHIYLHMDPYRGNLSPKRLQSIRHFAAETEKYLTGRQADLLYFLIPANSFVPAAERLKKSTGAKIVLDVIDLWPESLPLAHAEGLPPVHFWKRLRNAHIGCADVIFTECGLYRELLSLPQDKTHVLYWIREEERKKIGGTEDMKRSERPGSEPPADTQYTDPADKKHAGVLNIAYIGAVNNIIDIDGITQMLQLLQKERPVTVHVIGYGKKKEAFLDALDKAGIGNEDYGAVYDEEEKAAVFRKCSFGLNMMVPQVKVGLTMKSLDYLVHGLPLLNTIGGDTWQLVEEYDAGINIPRQEPETIIPRILAMADDPLAGRDARRLYEERFTKERFEKTLEDALGPILAGCRPLNAASEGRQTEQEGFEPPRTDSLYTTETKATPEISVAMTACNGEKYIGEQLDSILPQLGENDEVVVSSDPSQDNTFQILCEYAAKDSRIRIHEGPGEGVIRNVENALRCCSGKKIFLADQDDVWLPGKVEKVSKLLDSNTLVLHDAQIVDEDLYVTDPSYMNWRRSRKGIAANIWKNSYIGCCMAFRRELLQAALPFPDDLPMHDQWLGLLAEKHGSVKLLRIPLLQYRRHGENATKRTHANPAQMLQWRANIIREVIRR